MRHRGPDRRRPLAVLAGLLAAAAGTFGVTGCTSSEPLRTPVYHQAPYDGDRVWGVVPLVNESGTSVADPLRVADAIIHEVQQIEGVDALPVDRVIVAMRALEIPRITSSAEAQEVMRTLGIDGLIVGSITAWSPYRPATLGLALELHVAETALGRGVDLYSASRAVSGEVSIGSVGPPPPVATAAAVFDASDHRVLKWVRDYADARHAPERPFGPDIYLVSMDRYARFAAFRLLGRMVSRERLRLAGM